MSTVHKIPKLKFCLVCTSFFITFIVANSPIKSHAFVKHIALTCSALQHFSCYTAPGLFCSRRCIDEYNTSFYCDGVEYFMTFSCFCCVKHHSYLQDTEVIN